MVGPAGSATITVRTLQSALAPASSVASHASVWRCSFTFALNQITESRNPALRDGRGDRQTCVMIV